MLVDVVCLDLLLHMSAVSIGCTSHAIGLEVAEWILLSAEAAIHHQLVTSSLHAYVLMENFQPKSACSVAVQHMSRLTSHHIEYTLVVSSAVSSAAVHVATVTVALLPYALRRAPAVGSHLRKANI